MRMRWDHFFFIFISNISMWDIGGNARSIPACFRFHKFSNSTKKYTDPYSGVEMNWFPEEGAGTATGYCYVPTNTSGFALQVDPDLKNCPESTRYRPFSTCRSDCLRGNMAETCS